MTLRHLAMAAVAAFALNTAAPAAESEGAPQSAAKKQAPSQTVRQAQEALRQYGFYKGPSTGVMGSQTRKALQAFQATQGLQPSGQLDPTTLASLSVDVNASVGGSR